MTKDEALQMCLEYIETNAHERKYVRHAIKQALAAPVPDYAWPTVEDYEREIWESAKANEAFRMGWTMARTTNDLFTQMEKNT